MKLLSKTTPIYGFEEYRILDFWYDVLNNKFYTTAPYDFERRNGVYLFNDNLPVKASLVNSITYWPNVEFERSLCYDHKELVDTAKKAYIHPSCKISRSLAATKYKKSLDPFTADIVVIPKPDYTNLTLSEYYLFINESAKIIVKAKKDNYSEKTHRQPINGERFGDLVTNPPELSCRAQYTIEDLTNATFFYEGNLLYVPNECSYIVDILTGSILTNKIVYEQTLQESLGDESNKLDFDSLCSIMDMLNSSDDDTVSAGLKSLSMMDWMHYPQSIKFILNNTNDKWNWIYNKACNSTSVKYMMNTICTTRRRSWWPGNYDEEIYEEDFELFKKLKCHYHNVQSDQVMSSIRSIEFMRVNPEGVMVPNIKQRL